ncbi:aldose epimerase family protein [Deinococcus sp.]|uniref:aldose epimerase family protein n=1 Tax=Deinococcus sp. TaxID=47478 RepID=UPI003C7D374D
MTANDSPARPERWGQMPDGRPVSRFTLTCRAGVTVQLAEYGARIVRVQVPDRTGRPGDVTLGHDTFPPYLDRAVTPYFGAVVGRYANRVALGRFELDGRTHRLPVNNGPNSLHGGPEGFDAALWAGEAFGGPEGAGVSFRLLSPDGDQGYPGALSVTVRYTLTPDGTLVFGAEATCTEATPINLSNHAYWNLEDGGTGSVLGHRLTLAADRYLPVSDTLIPLGEEAPVGNTPFDFLHPKAVGRDLTAPDEQLRRAGGYDHHFVLPPSPQSPSHAPADLRWAGTLEAPVSGRQMQLWTTEPGLQMYSGNFLDAQDATGYRKHSALCLETQHAPDAPNQPQLGHVILRPGEVFRSRTEWRFSAQG